MKKLLFLTIGCLWYISATAQTSYSKSDIKNLLKKVADWQMANPHPAPEHNDLNWPQAALYIGMLDWAELAEKENGDATYYDWLLRIGRRNYWQPDQRMYHADDIAVSQTFLDLYRKYKDEAMIIPTLARADWIVKHPSNGSFQLKEGDLKTLERWTWCDALFMAPPVYAKLYRLTGDKAYIRFMNREYKATYDSLFDPEENLFYRDWRYFDKREANGKKVFWGRGNGWVLGGLVEILKELPENDKSRSFYKDLFVKLVTRVGSLQHEDGFWHASLLDPASYPSPETSCTTFIVYALAYGIHEGLIDRTTWLPVLTKGWDALVSAVEPSGKLGYVQQIGADPKKVTRDMTEVYGVGAFLLAGCEIYKMAK